MSMCVQYFLIFAKFRDLNNFKILISDKMKDLINYFNSFVVLKTLL